MPIRKPKTAYAAIVSHVRMPTDVFAARINSAITALNMNDIKKRDDPSLGKEAAEGKENEKKKLSSITQEELWRVRVASSPTSER